MDKIISAVDWAKNRQSESSNSFEDEVGERYSSSTELTVSLPPIPRGGESLVDRDLGATTVELDSAHLQSQRIIAHDVRDPFAKSFDMLRTPVLQAMDANDWQFLGVTSPTTGCGKTVTAANLAISMARNLERPVMLVDMNLRGPSVAQHLGIENTRGGLAAVLEGAMPLSDAIVQAKIGNIDFLVLPAEAEMPASAEWILSRSMASILQTIRRDYVFCTVIFDLPPVLAGDDVIALLPKLDCVLLVAAAGQSTAQDIIESRTHIKGAPIVRLVVNKVPKAS